MASDRLLETAKQTFGELFGIKTPEDADKYIKYYANIMKYIKAEIKFFETNTSEMFTKLTPVFSFENAEEMRELNRLNKINYLYKEYGEFEAMYLNFVNSKDQLIKLLKQVK